jgi:hypothetical protein
VWCSTVLPGAVLPDQSTCGLLTPSCPVLRRPKASGHRMATERFLETRKD